MTILFLVVLLAILFLLSRQVTRLLSHLFMALFHNQTTAIYLLSFLFLPGVVLHELSHLFLANILLVPTGEVEFFPEIHGSEVKMGSVVIAKTDPFRRFFIGIAPVLGGLGVILIASSYLLGSVLSWQSVVLFYIVFQAGNTMFSSKKDMEGAVGLLIGVAVLGLLLQAVGLPLVTLVTQWVDSRFLLRIVSQVNMFLLLAIGGDVFLVLLFEGVKRLVRH